MNTRHLLAFAATALSLGGCVAYVPPYAFEAQLPQPAYAPPAPAAIAPSDWYTYYQGRPAVWVSGVPYFIVSEPGYGWGWWGPGHRWVPAPAHWGPRLNAERGRWGR